MPGAETKGKGRAATYINAKQGYKKGGRIKAAHGWGRTNLLDESRRIRSEPQTRNVIDEEARVRGELSRGFKGGGGAKKGKGLRGGGVAKKGKGVAL
jgi:hypothetical protein